MNKMQGKIFRVAILSVLLLLTTGCRKAPVPKEYGYFRIALPQHQYTALANTEYPYSFELSKWAKVKDVTYQDEKYWIDIYYPQFDANIHCSYKPIAHNLASLSRDAQEFVYSHAMKATSIPEHEYSNDAHRVYGLLYDLEGNTATPVQFYFTDSIANFFRGSLYFNCVPNQDSLMPVTKYIREDIIHLMETFQWQ